MHKPYCLTAENGVVCYLQPQPYVWKNKWATDYVHSFWDCIYNMESGWFQPLHSSPAELPWDISWTDHILLHVGR